MTKAGPTGSTKTHQELDAISDAIIEIFALFELAFHNQYNKAFSTPDKENLAKRLWFSQLKDFSPEQIKSSADKAIKTSEYLPTIKSILTFISQAEDIPLAHDAYLECCRAPSPKTTYEWSHPIVYWTGKACGWHFLNTNIESIAYPIFKEKYQSLCLKEVQGKTFSLPKPHDLPEPFTDTQAPPTTSKDQARKHLNALFS